MTVTPALVRDESRSSRYQLARAGAGRADLFRSGSQRDDRWRFGFARCVTVVCGCLMHAMQWRDQLRVGDHVRRELGVEPRGCGRDRRERARPLMLLPILDVIDVTVLLSAISQWLFGFGARMILWRSAYERPEAKQGGEDLAGGHAALSPAWGRVPGSAAAAVLGQTMHAFSRGSPRLRSQQLASCANGGSLRSGVRGARAARA